MRKKLLLSVLGVLAVVGFTFAALPDGWSAVGFWNDYGAALTTEPSDLTATSINVDKYKAVRDACAAWDALDDEQKDAVLALEEPEPPMKNLDRTVRKLQKDNLAAARGALTAIAAQFGDDYDATSYKEADLAETLPGQDVLLKSWDAVKEDADLAAFFNNQDSYLAKVAEAVEYATEDKWINDANKIADPSTTKDVSLEAVEALITSYDALTKNSNASSVKTTLEGYKTTIEGQISTAEAFVTKVKAIEADGKYNGIDVDVTNDTDVKALETEYAALMQPVKAAEAKALIDGWRKDISLVSKNAEITGYVNGFNEALGVVAGMNGVFNLTDNDVENDYTGLSEKTDYQCLSQLVENYQKIYKPEEEAYWEGTDFATLTASIINANKFYAEEMEPYYKSMKAAVEFLADENNLYGADAATSDLVKYVGENDGLKNVIDVQNALANENTAGLTYILQLYKGAKKDNLDVDLYNEAMTNYQTKFRKDAADAAVAAYKAKYAAEGAALHADYEEAKEDYDPTTVKELGSRDAFNAYTNIASDVTEYTFDAEKYGEIAAVALSDAEKADVVSQAQGQLTSELATLGTQLRSAALQLLTYNLIAYYTEKYIDVIVDTDPTAEGYDPANLYQYLEPNPDSTVSPYKGVLNMAKGAYANQGQLVNYGSDVFYCNWTWDSTTNLIVESTTAPASTDDKIGQAAYIEYRKDATVLQYKPIFENMYTAAVFMIKYKDFIEKSLADITSADKADAENAKAAYDALSTGAKPYVQAIESDFLALHDKAVNDYVTSGSITLYTCAFKSGVAVTEDYSSLESIIDIAATLKDSEGNLRPNALVYVDAVLDVELPTNVIAKNANGEWWATAIELQDFKDFYVPEDVEAQNITIHKTIYAEGEGKVNPMYLPIDLTLEQLQDAFPGVIVRYLNAVYEKQDPSDATMFELFLNFHRKAAGEICYAYMPYTLECAAGDYDIEVTEPTTLKATPASATAVSCTTVGKKISASLYGYNRTVSVKSEPTREIYVIGRNEGTWGLFGVATDENGVVVRDINGDIVGKSHELPAGRLRLVLKKDAGINYIIRNYFDEDGEITGIENVEQSNSTKEIYTVNGVKVENMDKPGLYIVNGKKFIKK